jgi:DNA-binding response OmpR family regulator
VGRARSAARQGGEDRLEEAIIQAVAGWGDDLSPNAIEVYVSRLRSKLEPAGIKIRTVRGFGYMLEEFKGEPRVAQGQV